jgi:hypothetical protein
MINELYNTAKECWAKYIDENDPYDWDILIAELEEFDKVVYRDDPYLIQFGSAIDRFKAWIKYNDNPVKPITSHDLADYLKNYNENQQAEFMPPPPGFKTARLEPQKIKCHSIIDERECKQAIDDESDYDEDDLFENIDKLL